MTSEMDANAPETNPKAPPDLGSLQKMTHLVYALQAASFFLGFSLFAAVIVNYIKKEDVAGTWLESHFRWQIRTFWFTLVWLIIGALTFIVVIGYFVLMGAGIWFIYRIAKGWVYLSEKRPLYAS